MVPFMVRISVTVCVNWDNVDRHMIERIRIQPVNDRLKRGKHSSSRFGDDHFRPELAELFPQIQIFNSTLNLIDSQQIISA